MPTFSVLTTVFDPPEQALRECLASVAAQSFAHWEHVVVDDCSNAPWVRPLLEHATKADSRVRVVLREENGGIVASSSTALAAATGQWIALLDHDDVLASTALGTMAAAIYEDPTIDVLYSDSDLIRTDGRLADPFYKPDFSPERLRSQNYITHFLVARRQLVEEVGGFRPGFEGAQDHDLVLRLTERARTVRHVPEILYHWRQAPASVASDSTNKPYAYESGRQAVAEQCARLDIDGTVELGPYDGVYRIRRNAPDNPLVSVIIPTRGSNGRVWGCERTFVVDAVASIESVSAYRSLEYVIVHDTTTPPQVCDALRRVAGDRVRLVPFDGPFNFAEKINVGVAESRGELVLLLNDDTELIEPESIGVMASHLQMPDVGMVGAKLLYSDGTLQHAGHLYCGHFTHALLGWPGDHPGPYRLTAVERECVGVTAAAAMLRRDVFDEVGGMWTALPANFNDVDLSLKIGEAGYRIVWTPYATWYHFESKSRDATTSDIERATVLQRWGHRVGNDPYWNPNLTPRRSDWLELPGRSGAPPYYIDAKGKKRWA